MTLVAIAVAALCVCLGQQLASYRTREKLDEIYMTAAFAKSGTHSQWLEAYAEEHPEVVKAVSHTGLASAYIPDLSIHNWTSYWHKPLMINPNMCAPYDTAVLEITLTEIKEADQRHTYAKNEDGSYAVDENGQLIYNAYGMDSWRTEKEKVISELRLNKFELPTDSKGIIWPAYWPVNMRNLGDSAN